MGNKFGKERLNFFIKLTLFDIYTYLYAYIAEYACMDTVFTICAYLSVFFHHPS